MFLLLKELYSRMAFLRQPTLWDGVFLTRHHLTLLLGRISFPDVGCGGPAVADQRCSHGAVQIVSEAGLPIAKPKLSKQEPVVEGHHKHLLPQTSHLEPVVEGSESPDAFIGSVIDQLRSIREGTSVPK